MKNKQTILAIFVIIILLIPVWIYLITPKLEQIPADYTLNGFLLHRENNRFEIDSEWTGETIANTFVDEDLIGLNNDAAVIKKSFRVEVLGEGVVYETSNELNVDRKSKKVISEDESEDVFYLFPKNVEKKPYKWWSYGYSEHHQFEFKNVEIVKGLETYHFNVENKITDDSEGYEFLELVPEKYKTLTIFSMNVWVEPVSGTVVNYQDKGTSYYADKETGEKVWDISQWGNEYNRDLIERKVEEAIKQKKQINLYKKIIPSILGTIAVILLIMLALLWRKKPVQDK
ncbi:DUF3068 domain-containing protein [Candidatus Woesearchaeota archaeon]|jgi:hypothetical protein|nr:DUF3068 domain-containing protein [Candidatus Woesearchaeota archaeon]